MTVTRHREDNAPTERRGRRPSGLFASAHPVRHARVWPRLVAGLLARGSSPGTGLPRTARIPVAWIWSSARRLQLRGQPRHWAKPPAPHSLL